MANNIHTVSADNRKLFPNSRCQIEDDEEYNKCIDEWTSYYRENPHLYSDVLNFGLMDFQKVILCAMFYNDYTLYDACRG